MATFLCTWNPKLFEWGNLSHEIEMLRQTGSGTERWTVGTSKQIKNGDRIFLLRQGKDKPGIVGSGWARSDVYTDAHWQDPTQKRNYVDIRWDVLLDPEKEPVLPRERLNDGVLAETHWSTQMSGIRILDHVALELERVWSEFLDGRLGDGDAGLLPNIFVTSDYEHVLTRLDSGKEETITIELNQAGQLVFQRQDGSQGRITLVELYEDSEDSFEGLDAQLGEVRVAVVYDEEGDDEGEEEDHFSLPEAGVVKEALARMELTSKERVGLIALYNSPEHTATATEMAEKLGYGAHIAASNLFTNIGKKLAEELQLETHGSSLYVVATFVAPGTRGNKHWLWTMRPELVEALRQHQWV